MAVLLFLKDDSPDHLFVPLCPPIHDALCPTKTPCVPHPTLPNLELTRVRDSYPCLLPVTSTPRTATMSQQLRVRRHMLSFRPARRLRLRLHIRLAREVIQIPRLPLR